jgi:hypothetical protein
VALENHGAVEARALNGLAVDDDDALARFIKAGENIEYGGLAAAGMADHAAEFATRHRQPQVFEHRDVATVGAGIALGDALDGNEFVGGHRITPET